MWHSSLGEGVVVELVHVAVAQVVIVLVVAALEVVVGGGRPGCGGSALAPCILAFSPL